MFVVIEDEMGNAHVIVWKSLKKTFRQEAACH